MFTIKHNIPQIKDKLERIKKLIDGGWQSGLVKIMEQTRDKVSELTPRSEEGGSQTREFKVRKLSWTREAHIADGWKAHTIGGGNKDREPVLATVYNEFTSTPSGETKEEAKLGGKGYTLLHILEYGSRPHTIEPKPNPWGRPGVLRFEVNGEEIFTRNVDHPGTKPYGMIRITRALMRGWLGDFARSWKSKLQTEWVKP